MNKNIIIDIDNLKKRINIKPKKINKKENKVGLNKKVINRRRNEIEIKDIDMDNFCEENNKLFKNISVFLDNPRNIIILMNQVKVFLSPKGKKIIISELQKNKDKIDKIIKNCKVVINYYKMNDEILKSEVGHFILYCEHNLDKIRIKNENDYIRFIENIINYPKLITLLKEIFYILSDYRSCIYFMTPNVDFKKTNKSIVNEFIKKFKSNQNICFSTISRYYRNDESPWGKYYTGVYSSFESLIILQKYYNNPLKELNIEFNYKKKNNNKVILKKISQLYNVELNKIEKIMNVTNYIIMMKKMKYNMHEVVNSIFDIIYEGVTIKNIQKCYIINNIKIFNQKNSYELGVKIYILVRDNFISNINCFENFDI